MRSPCTIYNDATSVAYFPLDSVNTLNDYGANLFRGISYGTIETSSAALGQAMYFQSNTSYFQAQCYVQTKNWNAPFSFSLWINPASTTGGGTVIHLSTTQLGNGTCYDPLVFTSTGELVAQSITNSPGSVVYSVKGPVLSANTWTHVAMVVGTSNSLRLFINGQLMASYPITSSIGVYTYGGPQYITLGNTSPYGPVPCLTGIIPVAAGGFIGGIDEFRMYNRELSTAEICGLVNL